MNNAADIRKFIKENPAVAYVAGAALIVLAVYMILFAPLLKKLGLGYAECRNCENQLWDARNTIQYAANLDKSVGMRVLISEKDASTGIEELTRYGKSLGINFSEMKPGEAAYTAGAPYRILPLEISMEATNDQFVKFVTSIDELKKAIVKIRSFNIIPDNYDRNTLKINMVLELYLSPDN
jgi:Tfp pilus assembly protein PilO